MKKFFAGVFAFSFLFAANTAFADSDSEDDGFFEVVAEDEKSADAWFTNPSRGEDYGDEDPEAVEREKARSRFVEIHRDESFIYYIDKLTARRINIPHLEEKMIDVWIKLDPVPTYDEGYVPSQRYYLEHYYIRPKRQQIQFMCELEISGRPSNDIQENRYSPSKWENLIPGSIEDTIYHAVMKKTGLIRDEAVGEEGTSIRDFIEKTVNVSL